MSARVALIIDVVESRRIEDFQAQRDSLIASLSRRHRQRGWCDSDYAVTAWDEFQGLVATPAHLPWVLWDLWLNTRPVSLRVAIGGGGVEWHGPEHAPINEAVTGEAFFLAREAMEGLRQSHHAGPRPRVAARWNEPAIEAAANGILRLVDVLVGRISRTQWDVIAGYEQLRKQADVAEALHKSESTVSRSLASSQYWNLQASLKDLESVLESGLAPSRDPMVQPAAGGT